MRKSPTWNQTPQQTGLSQADRFTETARALGADEDEAAFRAKLVAIARQKPKDALPAPPVKAAKPVRKPKGG
jgi:hypothetical protein